MDKLIGTIVVCGLVLVLFLGVFQGGLGGDIGDQGKEVGTSLTNVDAETAIGGN